MQISVRSYLAAGVAVVGAGAMAVTPVQPPSSHLALTQQMAFSELAVELAAAVTPVNPFENLADLIGNTGGNIVTVIDDWITGVYVDGTFPFPPNTGIRPQPLPNNNAINGNLGWRTGGYATGTAFPVVTQALDNLMTYLNQFPDIGGIAGQIVDTIGNALQAPFVAGVDQPGKLDGLAGPTFGTLTTFNQNVNGNPYFTAPVVGPLSQRDVSALLSSTILVPADLYATLKPVIDFATTPISGLLIGAIGPVVGPVLSLVNSVTNAVALLQESDFLGALTELVNIPVNVTNAFLNGGPTLDLTGLVAALGVELPSTITSIGLKMGGLLSPGGVAFDALAANATAAGISVDIPGLTVGPIGALLNVANYMATAMVPAPTQQAAAIRAASSEAPAPAAEVESARTTALDAVEEADPVLTATEVHQDLESAPAPTRERKTRSGNRTGGAASEASDSGERTSATRGAASRRAG